MDGFHATGEVSLSGAEIGGTLSCIDGQFENPKGLALNAQGTRVRNGLLFRNVTVKGGFVDLNSAHVGTLSDDLGSWPKGKRVILDGFTYDRIIGAPTDSKARLNWLANTARFDPPSYRQLAKALRNQGHDADATDELIANETLKRKNRQHALKSDRNDGTITWWKYRLKKFEFAIGSLFGKTIGYGYRLLDIWKLIIPLCIIATALAQWAWMQGDMVPNSDVILTSENWAAIHDATNPASSWEATPEGQSWESFCSFFWGLDLVVPILDLGQTQAWTPSTNLGFAGQFLWGAKSILTILGWIVLAFAAAGVTGVARRD